MNKNIIMELENKINTLLLQKESIIIGIDGQCTSGKTTLAGKLSEKYDCNVFHMDDFFLRPEQRTPARFAEPGGNVDYERFHDEVIVPLTEHREFSYRPYDCHTGDLKDAISVTPKSLNIIEGTYCLHPHNAFAYDLSACMKVNADLQRERILQRNPALHEKFFKLWIPLEEQYFSWLNEHYKFDVVITT